MPGDEFCQRQRGEVEGDFTENETNLERVLVRVSRDGKTLKYVSPAMRANRDVVRQGFQLTRRCQNAQ